MITSYLTSLGLTRDSALWFYGKIAGAILFLASIGAEATNYGIPSKWLHVIQIAAMWITYFSAQQSTSQLNGK
jgi:hypothetical protein